MFGIGMSLGGSSTTLRRCFILRCAKANDSSCSSCSDSILLSVECNEKFTFTTLWKGPNRPRKGSPILRMEATCLRSRGEWKIPLALGAAEKCKGRGEREREHSRGDAPAKRAAAGPSGRAPWIHTEWKVSAPLSPLSPAMDVESRSVQRRHGKEMEGR